MDFHLKQCRNQAHESDQQHSANISKFLVEPHHQQPEPTAPAPLPLFVPDSSTKSPTFLSAFPDSTSSSSRFPKMWSCFSMAQKQELELQALIFRYMLAGAAIPPELLYPIKKSLLSSTPFFLHHPLQHHPTSWYWGRAAMDPEPGRCRRTDGKKWRCSRDVVSSQKYCERHMHRGRNRSRKPVETNSTATATVCPPSLLSVESGNYFSLSKQSPSVDLLHLNQGDPTSENKNLCEGKSGGRILRHFFDDWPRSIQRPDTSADKIDSATSLSDVSLKLSTGSEDEAGRGDRELNWAAGWAATHMASMGGPLAEALRSAHNSSSPTSVLHQLPVTRASAPEGSFISTLS